MFYYKMTNGNLVHLKPGTWNLYQFTINTQGRYRYHMKMGKIFNILYDQSETFYYV